jgi:MrcB-like, N-terminal domain
VGRSAERLVTVAAVPLRDVLSAPAGLAYDAHRGADQPAQVALREGRRELSELVPPGYRVRASGAAQNLPVIPWLAVLDEEVTTTAQEGLYVVYLFTATLDRVILSMNQGVTAHREHFRALGDRRNRASALPELRREAQLLRAGLDIGNDPLFVSAFDLGGIGFLPRAYESGNIVGKSYTVAALPSEDVLRADLDQFLVIYRDTVSIRDAVLVHGPGNFTRPPGGRPEAPRYVTIGPPCFDRKTRVTMWPRSRLRLSAGPGSTRSSFDDAASTRARLGPGRERTSILATSWSLGPLMPST